MEKNLDEIGKNGYKILRGKSLKTLKEELKKNSGGDIDVGTKTTVLGIFNFRALLNIGMLITEGEKAKEIRSNL